MPGFSEADSAVFDAIKQVTSMGLVVVETAGNGSQDLDNTCYGGRFNRSVRDSGAVLVAANSGPGLGPRSDTNYGSRIDVQGWGNNVATLGNFDPTGAGTGTCTPAGYTSSDPLQQYTTCFDGTSAAGPIVAGAVLVLQGIQKARNGRVYQPATLRDMLHRFGTPQVPNAKLIGPLPNLRATVDWMRADDDADGVMNGDELSLGRNPAVNEALLIGILNGDEP